MEEVLCRYLGSHVLKTIRDPQAEGRRALPVQRPFEFMFRCRPEDVAFGFP